MACLVVSVSAIGNRARSLWSKVSRVHSLLLISGPFDTNAVEKVPASQKRATKVKAKLTLVAAKLASPRQLRPIRAKPTTAKESSLVLEVEELLGGNRDWGKSLSKGKDASGAGTKRKSTGSMTGPPAKRPHVEPTAPNLGELDHMAALVNGMWDEVLVAREVVHTAEGRLRTVEGRLRMMEDWVREMRCRT